MRTRTLAIAAAVWGGVGLLVAQGGDIVALPALVKPDSKQEKAAVVPSDPAEPPLKVEVSYGPGTADARLVRQPGGRVVRGGPRVAVSRAVTVASSARGTVLTLNTPGGWQGSAKLTFKDGAPPMRFTLKLTRMPGVDLQSLTLSSGSVSLAVGAVGTAETTKYFSAKGQAQQSDAGAAYTLTARRRANGDVDLQVRRAAGAALGKALSVGWAGDFGRGKFGGARLGAARLVIDN